LILTVTLNPAIDLTYHVGELKPGQTHRVSRVDERLGGKGVNVASVLTQLGVPTVATGLLRDGPPAFFPIAGATRRTVVVTDGRDATGFWEPGPVVTPAEWQGFLAHFSLLLKQSRVVVLSGSLPGGLPGDAYASLVELCRAAAVSSILDTSGPALRLGVAAGPDVVKPNADELAELGVPGTRTAGRQPAQDRAGRLGMPGTRTVVVASRGADGLEALRWRTRPPRRMDGNPTGAGDACVAALARGLLHGTEWPDLLRDATALSAAAVASPVAGAVDLELYETLLPHIVLEEI
jgi:tagatose 6-phosphate kinase